MPSVTNTIKRISQPSRFVPKDLIKEVYYDSNENIVTGNLDPRLLGLTVDYMTRFMTNTPIQKAFEISLRGAIITHELHLAHRLLNDIRGLDRQSIIAAYNLVKYDTAYRAGKDAFYSCSPVVDPTATEVDSTIRLINRTLDFFTEHGTVIKSGFAFEKGYSKAITSGDGDYLTSDGLWDLKTSINKPRTIDYLQLLVYYILGYHSTHQEFKSIKTIGIFNPILNKSFTIELNNIPDSIYHAISREVIMYNIPDDESKWRERKPFDYKQFIDDLEKKERSIDTGFQPNNYTDGIHNISADDYWTYFKNISNSKRPRLKKSSKIQFVKSKDCFMFVYQPGKKVMYGDNFIDLPFSLEYHQKNLSIYCGAVMKNFGKYWDTLYGLKKYLHSLYVTTEEKNPSMFGKVQGLTLFISHKEFLYLNPLDNSIYPCQIIGDWQNIKIKAYSNLTSLLAETNSRLLSNHLKQLQELSMGFKKDIQSYIPNIDINKELKIFKTTKHIDTSIIAMSALYEHFQHIYDYKLVTNWFDEVLTVPENFANDAYSFIYKQLSVSPPQ